MLLFSCLSLANLSRNNQKDMAIETDARSVMVDKMFEVQGTDLKRVDAFFVPNDNITSYYSSLTGMNITAHGVMIISPHSDCQLTEAFSKGGDYIHLGCLGQPMWDATNLHFFYPENGKYPDEYISIWIDEVKVTP